MSNDDLYKKVVVFIDSLGNDDLEYMPWVRENMAIGEMDAGPVYVTPVVLGSIYTGTSPTQHGLPSVSRYEQQPRLRPDGLTIPEIAAATDDYENVVQFGLPFIVPPQVDAQGNYWAISEAMGQQSVQPGDAAAPLSIPAPAGALDKPGENLDLAFNLRVDQCMATFGTARNLLEMWETDVMFVSYRVADSYCHYHYSEPEDGDGNTYRQDLLTQVDREIAHLANQADVFVFGDHGARELDELFRLNRWLMENGYLDVEIDHRWREKAQEYGVFDLDDDVPGEVLQAGAPGVTIDEDESVAIGADPFSTGITLLDGASETAVEDLIADLHSEDVFEDVGWTTELFGPGDLQDECPDLYAVRKPGVFVSGNLHPEPGGPEITRSGVHHPIGAYGATADVTPPNGRISPQELFSLIARDFLDLAVDDAEQVTDQEPPDTDDRDVRAHLQDLGYI